MGDIRILGTGSYLPQKNLSNQDLEKMGLETSDDWILERTGIRERRVAEPQTAASDLGLKASRQALEMAGISAKDLDVIIMATITPDTCCPAGANWLQAKLQAPQAVSFDVTAACSGFIFGLNIAQQYVQNKSQTTILVVASEIMTRTLDWTDRSSCILWGDGAGAAVISKGTQGPELLSTHIHSDGTNGQNLLMPGGGSRTTPISHSSVDQGLHNLQMIEANLSFKVAVRYFIESAQEAAAYNRIDIQDIDWFIPHQANLRMFQSMAKRLKVSLDRFYLTLEKYGNISSASCAIALDEAVRDGSIKSNDLICLPVFGGGLTWGSALIRW